MLQKVRFDDVHCTSAAGEGLGELNKALAAALKPQTLKELRQRGTAATRIIVAAGNAAAASSTQATDSDQAEQVTEGMNGASASVSVHAAGWGEVQGQAGSSSGEAGEAEEVEGADAKGPLDPEDEWLFGLTDNQLFKIIDQDEAKARAREAAALAKGISPYAESEQEADAARATATAAAAAAAHAAAAGAAATTGSHKAAAGLAVGESSTSSSTEGGAGDRENNPDDQDLAGDEDEDGWVELTQEEIELLRFMDEYEAAEAAKAENKVSGARLSLLVIRLHQLAGMAFGMVLDVHVMRGVLFLKLATSA